MWSLLQPLVKLGGGGKLVGGWGWTTKGKHLLTYTPQEKKLESKSNGWDEDGNADRGQK